MLSWESIRSVHRALATIALDHCFSALWGDCSRFGGLFAFATLWWTLTLHVLVRLVFHPTGRTTVCTATALYTCCMRTRHTAGYAHCGTEVVVDTRGNCVLMPSVVERVFRPRRTALNEHYLEAYTTAIDALVARHAHTDSSTSSDGADGRALQVAGLCIEPDENDPGYQRSSPSSQGTFRCTGSSSAAETRLSPT